MQVSMTLQSSGDTSVSFLHHVCVMSTPRVCHVYTTCVSHMCHMSTCTYCTYCIEHIEPLHTGCPQCWNSSRTMQLPTSICRAMSNYVPMGLCSLHKGQTHGSQWWSLYRGYTVGYTASHVNITLEPTIFLHSGSQWACSTAIASSVLRGNHLFSLDISNHVARRMRSAGPVQSNSKT